MESVKEELKMLFEYRDKVVREASAQIFNKIKHVLGGINTFLSETDKTYAGGSMLWEDVQYMEDNDIIVVFGVLSFLPGSKINIGGRLVDITESNANSFQRMVRIGIPINLASEGLEQDIVKFLGNLDQKHESLDNNNVRNLASELPVFPTHKKTQQDFDWGELTDEQKRSLVIGNVSQKPS